MSTKDEQPELLKIAAPKGGLAALAGGWCLYPAAIVREVSPAAIARYILIATANAEGGLVPKTGKNHDEELLRAGFIEVVETGIRTSEDFRDRGE